MSLVDRYERYLDRRCQGGEAGRVQPFRRDIQQLVCAGAHPGVDLALLGGGQGTVYECGADSCALQRRHLILHQRDERRYDQCHTRQQECGYLIAQALAAAGGHDAECVASGKQRVYQLALPLPETVIAEVCLQRLQLVHAAPSSLMDIIAQKCMCANTGVASPLW